MLGRTVPLPSGYQDCLPTYDDRRAQAAGRKVTILGHAIMASQVLPRRGNVSGMLVMESRSECSKRSSLRLIGVWRVGSAETPYIPIPQQASDVPARDRFQTICSAVGTRCRTGPFIFVMARTRRYSIEIRNGISELVFVTAADWDEEDRRAAVAQILRLDGVLGLGKASDMGRGFSQSEGSDSPSNSRRRRRRRRRQTVG
jgi:hypothetical protein